MPMSKKTLKWNGDVTACDRYQVREDKTLRGILLHWTATKRDADGRHQPIAQPRQVRIDAKRDCESHNEGGTL